MWRCFSVDVVPEIGRKVCSTHVEMFPARKRGAKWEYRLLHACGDVSRDRFGLSGAGESAPRMWRCFPVSMSAAGSSVVCSTHVEMFPNLGGWAGLMLSLLHACGDVSVDIRDFEQVMRSAPRMWRCFYNAAVVNGPPEVCSTHVEMFPRSYPKTGCRSRLLHACGDVSAMPISTSSRERSAPRMWRCFYSSSFFCKAASVCSTHVEMFLTDSAGQPIARGLLHACGDVSSSHL